MGRGSVSSSKIFRRKRRFCIRGREKFAYVGITRAKKEAYLSFAMKRAYHGDWMDTLPSRFINEIPEDSVENEISINDSNDFDFNQDNTIEFEEGQRSPGWERYRKINKYNGKNRKIKKKFEEEKIDGYLIPKMMNISVNLYQILMID